MRDPRSRLTRASGVALLGLALAALGAAAAALSGLGARFDWWHFATGFAILRWATYGALAGGLLSLAAVGIVRPGSGRRGLAAALLGLVLAAPTVLVPWQWLQRAHALPPIHDITTDTRDPPEFVAVKPLRRDAPNATRYGGERVARLQRQAYPDIEPAILPVPPERAFEAALALVREKGWEVHAADRAAGRIEATDTTFWYGFKDDVVIRVVAHEGDARVDVRSVSRVGVNDVGTNARRVRSFLDALRERIDARG